MKRMIIDVVLLASYIGLWAGLAIGSIGLPPHMTEPTTGWTVVNVLLAFIFPALLGFSIGRDWHEVQR